jgi:hypothetical protein
VIPAEFTGGWVRASISLDGSAPFEDTLVWWLQSSSAHADLRVPHSHLDGATDGEVISFAGETVWTNDFRNVPSLTWIPALELVPNEFPDTGVVSWEGADLLEAGVSGEVSYVERWQRLAGTSGPLQALSRPGGRLVRTGSLALTIVDDRASGGAFNAVAWRLVDDAWMVDHRSSADASAPAPPTAVDLGVGTLVLLDDGALWTVNEASVALAVNP